MRLIERGKLTEDRYQGVPDDAPLPPGRPVIVSASRLLAQAEDLHAHHAPIGVIWPNNRKVAELVPHLGGLALIGLVFPSFRDGRAYSQARILRERHGFAGELRATGQILRDQFIFLLRAGFESLEVAKDADAAAFPEVMRRYSVFYQPTADGRPTVRRARLGLDRRVA
jgi:uncharacterized protein (DUF934 family)